MRTAPALAVLPLLALLATASRADTLHVDAAGGGDFTTVQAAVDAAAPDDVILVAPGFYPGFTVDKPLRVLGESFGPGLNAVIDGTVTVRDLPAGEVAALGPMFASFLRVLDCAGTVFVDTLNVTSPSSSQGPDDLFCVEVVASADVRFRQFGVNPGNGSGRGGMLVRASLVETDGAAIDGARGVAGSASAPDGGPGGTGILVDAGGELRFHNGRARGGQGGDALFSTSQSWLGGDGGDGIRAEPGTRLVVGGNVFTQLVGGRAGRGSLLQDPPANCALEGAPAPAVRVAAGASARVTSEAVIEGGLATCQPAAPPVIAAGELVLAVPPDLGLHWEGGIPQVGIPAALEVDDVPGTLAALLVGLDPLLQPIFKWKGNPLLVAPLIITPVQDLGADGFASLPVNLPPGLPPGLTLVVQAAALRADGSFQLSNSSTHVTLPPQPPVCDPVPCDPDES